MSGSGGGGNVDNSDDEASKNDTSDTSENENDEQDENNDNLDKTEFKNWVRGMKGLEYLQQGLAPFVDREFAIRQATYICRLKLGPQAKASCNCTFDNILPDHAGGPCNRQNFKNCRCYKPSKKRRKCPNNICSKLYDFIVVDHRFTNPSWTNSDISDWTNKCWSVAKCFLSDSKYSSTSAKTTDAAGLLNIITNAEFFQQKIACLIDPPNDIFSQARESRNIMMHKATMELTDQELNAYIDLFISVLQDSTTLLNDQDAMLAVNNLNKLKNNQIYIDVEEKKKILKDALQRIEEERMKALGDIESSKSNALYDIEAAKTEKLEKLQKFDTNAMTELEKRIKRTEEEVLALKATKGAGASSENEETVYRRVNEEETDSDSEEDIIPTIATDEDERKDMYDEPIELRAYQEELARMSSDGHNVIVLAPTNTGKTRVACKIIQDHFRRRSQIGEFGKVMFLVHTEPLAFQQGQQCANILPYYRTKVITGRVQREKKQLLKDFLEKRDILVVIAEVLVNALKLREIQSLKEFSLIVIDECHHTSRWHSFKQTMSRYIDLKLTDNFALPQIVGLTACLGVGGTTDYTAAKEYMKGLLVNLDAHFLSTVRANLEQLNEFASKAKEYKVIARKRPNDSYRQAILDIINDIDVYMINHPSMRLLQKSDEFIKDLCCVPLYRGSEKFMQWVCKFEEGIAQLHSDDVIRMMNPCRLHLEIYNKALMLHADARICDAKAILSEFMENERSLGNETVDMLLDLYKSLTSKNFDGTPENPKLEKMEEILTTHLKDKDSRCIIFAKSLILVKALTSWINETESLRYLNAKQFVGRKKMSRINQKNALEYFRNGHHKVIVATSVAEEGLDVTTCNLVIRYEHVKNEIVRLQSRGRARAKNSRYYILTEEGSSLLEKEEENEMKENLMHRIVPELATYTEENPERWQRELKNLQEAQRAMEQNRERAVQAIKTDDVKRLHCLNCNTYICLSSNIRLVRLCHYIAIDEDVLIKLVFRRNPVPKYKEDIMKCDGHIFCANCQRELGGVFEYQETEFPMIKIKHFRVIDRNDLRKRFRKWSEVNFKVEQMSFNELDRIVQIRDDYTY